MSSSGTVDITELSLKVDLADTMSAINEKDLALLVNDDAGSGVSVNCVTSRAE